jgi:hypothetical protein
MWKPDPWTVVRELARWPVTTQFNARRNALLACTAFAQRRRERDDVEQFIIRMNARARPQSTALSSPNRQGSSAGVP